MNRVSHIWEYHAGDDFVKDFRFEPERPGCAYLPVPVNDAADMVQVFHDGENIFLQRGDEVVRLPVPFVPDALLRVIRVGSERIICYDGKQVWPEVLP